MRRIIAYMEQAMALVFVVLSVWLLWQTISIWSVSGYIERARFAFHSGLYSAALTQVEEALKDRETAGLHILRASIQAAQMEFPAAAQGFLKAISLMPTSTAAKIGRASCLLEMADAAKGEKRKKQIARARALLKGTPGGDAKVVLASIALMERETNAAERLLLSAEAAGLTFHALISYYITRSLVESRLGHHKNALSSARKAILISPKRYGYSPKQCGGMYYRSYTDALRALILAAIQYIKTATPDSFPKIAAEIEGCFGEEADKRFGIAARFWKNQPETFLVYLVLGNTAFRVGRFEEALKAYKEAWRRCPRRYPEMMRVILLNRALTYRSLSRKPGLRLGVVRQYLRESAACYAQVAFDKRASKQLRFWSHLAAAQSLFEMNDFSGARRHAQQAFDLADFRIGLSSTPALLAMAVCADKEGKKRRAIDLYKRVLAADDLKNKDDVKRRLGQLERRRKR